MEYYEWRFRVTKKFLKNYLLDTNYGISMGTNYLWEYTKISSKYAISCNENPHIIIIYRSMEFRNLHSYKICQKCLHPFFDIILKRTNFLGQFSGRI